METIDGVPAEGGVRLPSSEVPQAVKASDPTPASGGTPLRSSYASLFLASSLPQRPQMRSLETSLSLAKRTQQFCFITGSMT